MPVFFQHLHSIAHRNLLLYSLKMTKVLEKHRITFYNKIQVKNKWKTEVMNKSYLTKITGTKDRKQ